MQLCAEGRTLRYLHRMIGEFKVNASHSRVIYNLTVLGGGQI